MHSDWNKGYLLLGWLLITVVIISIHKNLHISQEFSVSSRPITFEQSLAACLYRATVQSKQGVTYRAKIDSCNHWLSIENFISFLFAQTWANMKSYPLATPHGTNLFHRPPEPVSWQQAMCCRTVSALTHKRTTPHMKYLSDTITYLHPFYNYITERLSNLQTLRMKSSSLSLTSVVKQMHRKQTNGSAV